MNRVLVRMMTVLMLLMPVSVLAQTERHLPMRLVAESTTPAAGSRVALAIAATPAKGWHGYWQNPGDAGFATQFAWSLPAGVKAGAVAYPVPGRLTVAGLMNYVYERPFAMLTTLDVPGGLAAGTTLPVRVKLDYLVCTLSLCVPEQQELATTLTVGDGAIEPAARTQFDTWRRALPRPLGSMATYQVEAGRLRLSVPLPASASVEETYFYPAANGFVDMAAPQVATRDGDRLVIETKAGAKAPVAAIAGVLATGGGQGLQLSAKPGVVSAAATESVWMTAALAFAGAVLGGLILNVMPCVFPILSLKALSLAKGGASERQARCEALAYTAGVILVCLALGAGLLALRAAGARVGWAFQLQDPRVIGVLLLLVMGIALNLAGLFELSTPRFAGESGAAGAFVTGALAAFVATPCTGPFMGAALGAALVLPTIAALLVFAGLGLGIALPFLLLGFVPALRRRLPKPGMWMERLRRVLSIPMFLTALALAWILGRQAGVDGMTIGLAATLLAAVGLWWTGRRQHAGRERAWWPAWPALALAIAAVVLVRPAPVQAVTAADTGERFSEARLATLRAQNKPVFAYFTADWCLTCKVNEKTAIETDTVRDAFRKRGVAVLVGDWTDGDPALGRFIEAHNRAGVPLYLWYAPGSAEPTVMPQVLTTGILTGMAGG